MTPLSSATDDTAHSRVVETDSPSAERLVEAVGAKDFENGWRPCLWLTRFDVETPEAALLVKDQPAGSPPSAAAMSQVATPWRRHGGRPKSCQR